MKQMIFTFEAQAAVFRLGVSKTDPRWLRQKFPTVPVANLDGETEFPGWMVVATNCGQAITVSLL